MTVTKLWINDMDVDALSHDTFDSERETLVGSRN